MIKLTSDLTLFFTNLRLFYFIHMQMVIILNSDDSTKGGGRDGTWTLHWINTFNHLSLSRNLHAGKLLQLEPNKMNSSQLSYLCKMDTSNTARQQNVNLIKTQS